MLSRISKALTAASILFFLALVIFAIPSFFDPEFEVINRSSETVSVFAAWRGSERDIGEILPQSSHRFSVDDEAAMTFKVRFASGREIESEPLYFTRGTKVIATISRDGMEVRYDFDA
ncbi:MAG TPA: hypothetical protein PKZ35_10755 [Gammaproteobacteria bacterium]|nr:hypothetical protein [Gammaproteobacteria bacterium]